ncbi:MAG TPA: dTDP-4-dehydrorhamnose reductase [Actinomycetota bacterium]|nr:dTDP-4-dehydrorhamnose reductase [Actinomycetota bacterium]
MRVAVTGAGGGLGQALAATAGEDHELILFAHGELAVEDLPAVMDRLVPARPEVIIHAAAMTSVDGCEVDPRGAFLANTLGTRNVAQAAARAGAVLVYISTDYVFDGEKGEPYHEFDAPNPISVYGASKLAGEREARTMSPEHLVVRTSWVFGGEKDFLTGALGRLAAGESVPAIVDLVGTPTYVPHLAERLIPLVRSGHRGVVHLGGPEVTTWHDVLVRAVDLAALPGEVAEQKADELERPARRPANSALASLVLPIPDVRPMPPLEEALNELMETVRGRR